MLLPADDVSYKHILIGHSHVLLCELPPHDEVKYGKIHTLSVNCLWKINLFSMRMLRISLFKNQIDQFPCFIGEKIQV